MKQRLDPVTQYATDVSDGKIIAAKLVRLACQRHLRDLAQQQEKGLEWRPASAQEVIDFFPEVLRLPENTDAEEAVEADSEVSAEGRPFFLSPFQQFIAGSLFGWYTTKGYRRFRVAYVETAKGSGKTPFGAGLMLYLLVADGERGAQIYAAAPTLNQAKDAFRDAERMVASSPALRDLIDPKVNNLAVIETGSFFRPVSSEKRGLDGKRVHGALVDELHEHQDGTVTIKIRAGTKGRRNALILEITNSGFDLESVCWKHHDMSRQILEGSLQNDAWFAFICHLDACVKCQAAGKYQPSDECPNCDDWKTEGPHWLKANPNLGVSLSWQYLREQVQIAVALPSERNLVRRLNFCQWTQQATAWIPMEKWSACLGKVSRTSLLGRECFIGLDLSDKIDLSSAVLVFPRPIERAFQVSGSPIDCAIDVISFFWMPEKTMFRRATEDKVPYVDWARAGHIMPTNGNTIDHDVIVDFIINDLALKYRILGVGIDDSGASGVLSKLKHHFGDDESVPQEQRMVWAITQGFRRLSTPSKRLEALIVSGNLAHDGNPCMNWCIGNMAIEPNTWQDIRPVKINQRKRIDGGVALIDAIAKMIETPRPEPVGVMCEWL